MIQATTRFGDYEIRTYETNVYPSLEVLHRGRSVFFVHEHTTSYGSEWVRSGGKHCLASNEASLKVLQLKSNKTADDRRSLLEYLRIRAAMKWVDVGADVTGNGTPNLVIFAGYRHYTATILELGRRFRNLGAVDLGDAGSSENFVDLDGDGWPEIEAQDWIFMHWNVVCTACSPLTRVVLKLHQGRFRVSGKQMKKPPLSKMRLMALAKKARDHTHWRMGDGPKATWGVMARLVYSGNAKQARQFLRLAWPDARKTREVPKAYRRVGSRQVTRAGFWQAFARQLRKSSFYKGLLRLNGGSL